MGSSVCPRNQTIIMKKSILSIQEAVEISNRLQTASKKIVLTGGCFDVLHIGHFKLLEHAKAAGDSLFVLLESDKKISELKGINRPLHPQKERAHMLAAIRFVDYVVLLPYIVTNEAYDHVVEEIHPTIIATTSGDKNIEHKTRQAKNIGAKVAEVVEYIPNRSTSTALKTLLEET